LPHKPVLLAEVLSHLKLSPGMIVVDGTVGGGGHSAEMLKQVMPGGRLIGLDQDPAAIHRCKTRLEGVPGVVLIHKNFSDLGAVLQELNVLSVDAVLLDVGFSSDQLEDEARGFSFERDGPLDMRMNPDEKLTARDYVNELAEQELANLLWKYGNERYSRRIAKAICNVRIKKNIATTAELASIVRDAVPGARSAARGHRPVWARNHPATKTFQALRIVVNQELKNLELGVRTGWAALKPGGRMAVISFHSLEDRIVKHEFLRWKQEGVGNIITRKPVCAGDDECRDNPRSRSAKLRVMEKHL